MQLSVRTRFVLFRCPPVVIYRGRCQKFISALQEHADFVIFLAYSEIEFQAAMK